MSHSVIFFSCIAKAKNKFPKILTEAQNKLLGNEVTKIINCIFQKSLPS
jgi:hypothetical protein